MGNDHLLGKQLSIKDQCWSEGPIPHTKFQLIWIERGSVLFGYGIIFIRVKNWERCPGIHKNLLSTPYALPVKNKESLTGTLPPFLNVLDSSEQKADSRSSESASTHFPPGFHPVQMHFGSRVFDWMLCQLFPLDSLCNSVGCCALLHSP